MKKLVLILGSLLFAVGCGSGGGSSGSSSASGMVIKGTLAGNTGSSYGYRAATVGLHARDTVDLTTLQFYVVCFSSPPQIVTDNLDSSGDFSVTLPASCAGSSISMMFRNATSGQTVGLVQFQQTTTDMSGNAQTTTSINLSGGVTLGNVQLGTDGNVTIPVSQIQSAVSSTTTISGTASTTLFDPTGTWFFTAYDGTIPTGYQTVGVATGSGNNGPTAGSPMTMFRMPGHPFTATAATGHCTVTNGTLVGGICAVGDGTVDNTTDRYALSIWGDTVTNGVGACGSVTGFTQDEARAFGQISITNPTVTVGVGTISFAHFAFANPNGYGIDTQATLLDVQGTGTIVHFNQPWMKNAATASYNIQNCTGITVSHGGNNYQAFACQAPEMTGNWPGNPDSNIGWQVGINGGGCINQATGQPVNVTNWNNFTGANNACATPVDASSTFGTGFTTNTCTYPNVSPDGIAAPITIVCSNTGGAFHDNAGTPNLASAYTFSAGTYLGQPNSILTATSPCMSAVAATNDNIHTLAAFQCYANAYYQNGGGSGQNCSQNYNFNWGASTPAQFVQQSGQSGKPQNDFATNILVYGADGQSGALEDVENQIITVPTGPNSSTTCNVSKHNTISFKKQSSTRILSTLVQTGHMDSPDPACQAAAAQALSASSPTGDQQNLQQQLTTQNQIFYLDSSP